MSGQPRIVLMGKGDNTEVFNMIKEIKTTVIPSELLASVFVTLEDNNRYKVSKGMFGKAIVYDSVEKQLESLNFGKKIDLVEIVLDFNKVHTEIERKTEEYLSQYFT